MLTYQINVAKRYATKPEPRYLHAFRVHVSDSATEAQAREVFAQISAAFPAPEYKVKLSVWTPRVGRDLASNDGA